MTGPRGGLEDKEPAVDEEDAGRVLAAARALAPLLADLGKTWRTRAMREAIKVAWEQPRTGREADGTRGGNHAPGFPWSPDARAWAASRSAVELSGRLRREHVTPVGELANHLMDHAASLTAPDVVRLLRQHLLHAIVTDEEDARLRAADARIRKRVAAGTLPVLDPADPWRRYREAGLPIEEFGPLT